MVPRKILWLSVLLDGDDSYILFGFAITTILLSSVTWLIIVANIQVITLLDKFLEPPLFQGTHSQYNVPLTNDSLIGLQPLKHVTLSYPIEKELERIKTKIEFFVLFCFLMKMHAIVLEVYFHFSKEASYQFSKKIK